MRAIIIAMLAFIATTQVVVAKSDQVEGIVQGCIATSDEAMCKANVAEFRSDWKKAHRGDYQAQRNVAFCLSRGCDGAVGIDPVQACAWRILIMASNGPVDGGDAANLRNECGSLPAAWKIDATNLAKNLFKKIYKRGLKFSLDE